MSETPLSWRSVRLTVLLFALPIVSSVTHAQDGTAAQNSKERFPYAFSNFPWWTETELRADLKERIPTLGNELATNSQMEARVRTELAKMLKEKGIQAEVQTLEPSRAVFGKRDPEAPPPAIAFSILAPPEIVVEKMVLDNPPMDANGSLNGVAAQVVGKPYSKTVFWLQKERINEALQQQGYLSCTSTLEPGKPREDGGRYLVPITASINAGPKYHVASIKADGGPLLQGRVLSPYFTVKQGDVAIPNPFGKLVGSLRSVYWHAGYPDVDFEGAPVLDTTKALASYQLKVIPGPLYHLRSITVEKLSAEQEVQAKEILGLKPGDIYDALAVAGLARKLAASASPLKGYGVSYSPKEDKENDVVDLTLTFYKE